MFSTFFILHLHKSISLLYGEMVIHPLRCAVVRNRLGSRAFFFAGHGRGEGTPRRGGGVWKRGAGSGGSWGLLRKERRRRFCRGKVFHQTSEFEETENNGRTGDTRRGPQKRQTEGQPKGRRRGKGSRGGEGSCSGTRTRKRSTNGPPFREKRGVVGLGRVPCRLMFSAV